MEYDYYKLKQRQRELELLYSCGGDLKKLEDEYIKIYRIIKMHNRKLHLSNVNEK